MPREREAHSTRAQVGRLKPLQRGGEDHQHHHHYYYHHHHHHHHHHHLIDAGASLTVGKTDGDPAIVDTSLRFKLYFLPPNHQPTPTTHNLTQTTTPPDAMVASISNDDGVFVRERTVQQVDAAWRVQESASAVA